MDIANHEIRTAVDEIKSYVHQQIDRLDQRLSVGTDALTFLDTALSNYRNAHLNLSSKPHRLLATYAADPTLRFPQRKILECLLSKFDYHRSRFLEIKLTQIVKEAHVSKGAINAYLAPLISRQLIVKRTDGYRVWLRINDQRVEQTKR